MKLSKPPAALVAAALAGALVTGIPGVAHAAPASPGDISVRVTVQNYSDVRLDLDSADLSEGDWTTAPPDAIKPMKKATFGSVSTEEEGGTEATVTYSTRYGDVEFYWDDPWQNDNNFRCEAPAELSCEFDDSDLDAHAKVKFTLR